MKNSKNCAPKKKMGGGGAAPKLSIQTTVKKTTKPTHGEKGDYQGGIQLRPNLAKAKTIKKVKKY